MKVRHSSGHEFSTWIRRIHSAQNNYAYIEERLHITVWTQKVLRSVSAQLFISQLSVAGSALIVNIFSARALGPEVRGELGLYMQIAYIANTICILGRQKSYLKSDQTSSTLSTTYEDMRRLSLLPLTLSVFVSAIIAAVLGNTALTSLFMFMGMIVLIISGIQQKTHRAAAIVARSALPYFISTVVGQAALVATAALMATFGVGDVSAWLAAYGITVMLPYIVADAYMWIRHSRSPRVGTDLGAVSRLGLKLMPLSTIEILGARADRLLIPALSNFGHLGIYSVVATMTELIAWPIRNYADSQVPTWSRQIVRREFRVVRTFIWIGLFIILLGALLGTILRMVIVPLFGPEYGPGVHLVWPLVVAAGLHALNHVGVNVSLAAGFTILINIIPAVGMITSVVAYLLLIPSLGALGAAWGLAAGYLTAMVPTLIAVLRVSRARHNRDPGWG